VNGFGLIWDLKQYVLESRIDRSSHECCLDATMGVCAWSWSDDTDDTVLCLISANRGRSNLFDPNARATRHILFVRPTTQLGCVQLDPLPGIIAQYARRAPYLFLAPLFGPFHLLCLGSIPIFFAPLRPLPHSPPPTAARRPLLPSSPLHALAPTPHRMVRVGRGVSARSARNGRAGRAAVH
jgi:hypothetical protein